MIPIVPSGEGSLERLGTMLILAVALVVAFLPLAF